MGMVVILALLIKHWPIVILVLTVFVVILVCALRSSRNSSSGEVHHVYDSNEFDYDNDDKKGDPYETFWDDLEKDPASVDPIVMKELHPDLFDELYGEDFL